MSIRESMTQLQVELTEGGKGKYQHPKRGKSGRGYPNVQSDKPGYGPGGTKREMFGPTSQEVRASEAERLRSKGQLENLIRDLRGLLDEAEAEPLKKVPDKPYWKGRSSGKVFVARAFKGMTDAEREAAVKHAARTKISKGKYESLLGSDSLLLRALTEDEEMLEGIIDKIKQAFKQAFTNSKESPGFKEMKRRHLQAQEYQAKKSQEKGVRGSTGRVPYPGMPFPVPRTR